MLNQFRNCYPQGSLISELLKIDHGKFIVRVIIQVDGITLGSGLAAADTIEQAEDLARIRALALINLTSTPSSQPSLVATAPTPSSVKVETKSEPVAAPSSVRVETKSEPVAAPSSVRVEAKPQSTMTPPPELIPQPELELSLKTEVSRSALSNHHESISQGLNTTKIPESQGKRLEKPQAQEPMDFSDIIAQTTVEMKRLGWTDEMGRDYVLKTYGKRSRHVLSDAELLEFLEFLRNQ
jgi:hypothetical protein